MSAIELVCPGGSPAMLRSAIEAGADSVYCGLRDETNARNFPGLNFSREEMAAGVDYARARGARVLVAINTFPRAGALDRSGPPRTDVRRAGIRDPPVHMTLLVDAVLLNEPVAFEAFERVVDLADVERPRRAGAPVELGSQLIPVAGPLIEDRQEALAHRHRFSALESGTRPGI